MAYIVHNVSEDNSKDELEEVATRENRRAGPSSVWRFGAVKIVEQSVAKNQKQS